MVLGVVGVVRRVEVGFMLDVEKWVVCLRETISELMRDTAVGRNRFDTTAHPSTASWARASATASK